MIQLINSALLESVLGFCRPVVLPVELKRGNIVSVLFPGTGIWQNYMRY